MISSKVISILGCGWFGQALAVHLVARGYTVKGSTTTLGKLQTLKDQGIRPYLIDLKGELPATDFFDCAILVVACGADIGDLARYIRVSRLIYISSTGVYGNGKVNEQSPVDLTKPHAIAEQKLARSGLTVIRFAGLVGPGRMPGRFLAGKKDLPNGPAPVNLIHLDDCIGLTEAIMDRADITVINGVNPDHPDRKTFYRLAAEVEGLVPPTFSDIKGEDKLVHTLYPKLYFYGLGDWLYWLENHRSSFK